MTKILMVCLGNICRSPLAEGILTSMVDSTQVYVDSAGTGGYHLGDAPDPRSIAIAKKNGIDISNQVCRKFTAEDFNRFDTIYVMDSSNYTNVVKLANSEADRAKVKLLLSEIEGKNLEVPDPYYGGDDGFKNVYNLIHQACSKLILKF